MRHIETFTKGTKSPPPNITYFKEPPPNTTSVLSPLNNDKNYKKPLVRRDHMFGRGAAKLSTKEDCVMIAPVTSEIQILHTESNTKQPSNKNMSTKECKFFVLTEH